MTLFLIVAAQIAVSAAGASVAPPAGTPPGAVPGRPNLAPAAKRQRPAAAKSRVPATRGFRLDRSVSDPGEPIPSPGATKPKL